MLRRLQPPALKRYFTPRIPTTSNVAGAHHYPVARLISFFFVMHSRSRHSSSVTSHSSYKNCIRVIRDLRNGDDCTDHRKNNACTLKATSIFSHPTIAGFHCYPNAHLAHNISAMSSRARHSSDDTSHASCKNCLTTFPSHTYAARVGRLVCVGSGSAKQWQWH